MKTISQHYYRTQNAQMINKLAKLDAGEFVKSCECQYYDQVNAAAWEISNRLPQCRMVLLAGPSASGKTTTAQKLSLALQDLGIHADVVSLDDFYLGKGNYPIREDGSEDYETIYSLDIELFHHCMEELFQNRFADFPIFDFKSGVRTDQTKRIDLGENGVVIVEGIHALNPLLSETVPAKALYKLYVSVNTKFAQDETDLLIPKCIRLIRRVVRDFHYRGVPAQITLNMWEQVCDGERQYITPYRDCADRKIDSTLGYEPCVFRSFLETVTHTVSDADEIWETLKEIEAGLSCFYSLPSELIPKDSLLREFIAE